jgi:two-component system, chemotaxis family, CheB/CheR fusion protein
MSKVLLNYVRHAYIWGTEEPRESTETKPDDFQSILAVLRTRTNHDFRCYKRGTLTRRIQRRMGLHQADTYGEYLEILRKDSLEVKQLFRDLLIGVTAFFRDPESMASPGKTGSHSPCHR